MSYAIRISFPEFFVVAFVWDSGMLIVLYFSHFVYHIVHVFEQREHTHTVKYIDVRTALQCHVNKRTKFLCRKMHRRMNTGATPTHRDWDSYFVRGKWERERERNHTPYTLRYVVINNSVNANNKCAYTYMARTKALHEHSKWLVRCVNGFSGNTVRVNFCPVAWQWRFVNSMETPSTFFHSRNQIIELLRPVETNHPKCCFLVHVNCIKPGILPTNCCL